MLDKDYLLNVIMDANMACLKANDVIIADPRITVKSASIMDEKDVVPCPHCGAVQVRGRCIISCSGWQAENDMIRAEFIGELNQLCEMGE